MQHWVQGALFGLLVVPFIYLLGILQITLDGFLFIAYAYFVFVPLMFTSFLPLELRVETAEPSVMPVLNTTGWIVSALSSMVMWAILFQLFGLLLKWVFHFGSKK